MDPNFVRDISDRVKNPIAEFINFRKFNATNMELFAELLGDETWGTVGNFASADEKYEQFIEIYNKHYNHAFEQK